jgi:hypothetical protein
MRRPDRCQARVPPALLQRQRQVGPPSLIPP